MEVSGQLKALMPDGTTVYAPEGTSPETIKSHWQISRLETDKANEVAAFNTQHKELSADDMQPYSDFTQATHLFRTRQTAYRQQISDLESKIEKEKADQGGLGDQAAYYAHNTLDSAKKALAGMAVGATPEMQFAGGGADRLIEQQQQLAASLHQPQTKGEKFADFVTQGVAGALPAGAANIPANGVRALLRPATVGAISGVGGGAANNLTAPQDSLEGSPLAAILGSLLAGGAASIPAALKTTRGAYLGKGTEGVTDEALHQGAKNQESINTGANGKATLPQAMLSPDTTNFDSLLEALASSSNGKLTREALATQPAGAVKASQEYLRGVGGQQRSPQEIANNMQEDMTKVIEAPKIQGRLEYEANKPQDMEIPHTHMEGLASQLKQYRDSKDVASAYAPMIDKLISSLKNKPEGESAGSLEDQLNASFIKPSPLQPNPLGERYHGTGKAFTELTADGGQSAGNILGSGLYTTDSIKAGNGYQSKGGRDGAVYNITEKAPIKAYNADAEMPLNVEKLVRKTLGSLYPEENTITGKPLTSLMDVLQEFRLSAPHNQLDVHDTQAYLNDVQDKLKGLGYNAYDHTGGKLIGDHEHNVRIYWNPTDVGHERLAPEAITSRLQDRAAEAASATQPVGKYKTDAQQVKNEVDTTLKGYTENTLNQAPKTPAYNRIENQVRSMVNQVIDPFLANSKAAYAARGVEADALKKSEAGRVAGITGDQSDREAASSKWRGIFSKGTVPGAATSEILNTQKLLSKTPRGDETYLNAAATYLGEEFAKARAPVQGKRPANVADNLSRVLGLGPDETAQSQGVKDILLGSDRARKLPEGTTYKAVRNAELTLRAFANRPSATVTSEQELRGAAQGSSLSAMKATDAQRSNALIALVHNWREGDAERFADKLINDPSQVETLIALRKAPPASPLAVSLLSTLLATEKGNSP